MYHYLNVVLAIHIMGDAIVAPNRVGISLTETTEARLKAAQAVLIGECFKACEAPGGSHAPKMTILLAEDEGGEGDEYVDWFSLIKFAVGGISTTVPAPLTGIRASEMEVLIPVVQTDNEVIMEGKGILRNCIVTSYAYRGGRSKGRSVIATPQLVLWALRLADEIAYPEPENGSWDEVENG